MEDGGGGDLVVGTSEVSGEVIWCLCNESEEGGIVIQVTGDAKSLITC